MANQSGQASWRKVRRTVTYWTAARKPRPAVITGLSSNGGVVLRVGHLGGTLGNTTTGILRRVNRTDTNVWSV